MKRRFFILIPLILFILALSLFFLKETFHFDFGSSLLNIKRTTAYESILTEIKEIFTLNTVEFVYKTVFPYDFLPAYPIDWSQLREKKERGETLYDREKGYLRIYDLCRKIGIPLDQGGNNFVVITTVVQGGFDLSSTIYEDPEASGSLSEYVQIDTEKNSLTLWLPDPTITGVEIEDPSSNNYSYPDIRLDPESWKLLTEFVSTEIRERVVQDDMLIMASNRGEAFIKKLLLEAGYSNIFFTHTKMENQ